MYSYTAFEMEGLNVKYSTDPKAEEKMIGDCVSGLMSHVLIMSQKRNG